VDLAPASFDAAGQELEDFRIIDPAGHEIALLLDSSADPRGAHDSPRSSFEVTLAPGSTRVTIATGTTDRLSSLSLETPSPFFLRAARVEISQDNSDWVTIDQGIPIFREWGAEKLDLPIGGRVAGLCARHHRR